MDMFEIYVETHFSAAHHLRDYEGKCATPHGHNWVVEVYLQCRELDEAGMGIDFQDVKAAAQELVEELDHRDLNQLPAFAEDNPTSENIAKYIFQGLRTKLDDERVKLSKVRVCETPGCGALYWE